MTKRPVAGENERKFEQLFEQKSEGTILTGKKRFALGEVEISVDQSFEYEGKEYLVEVDSANMAKLIVGQYVLLNQLHKLGKDAFFLVVHTYKKYNPMRTVHNLSFVNQGLLAGNGIPFGAIHIEELKNWSGGISGLIKMLAVPQISQKR